MIFEIGNEKEEDYCHIENNEKRNLILVMNHDKNIHFKIIKKLLSQKNFNYFNIFYYN